MIGADGDHIRNKIAPEFYCNRPETHPTLVHLRVWLGEPALKFQLQSLLKPKSKSNKFKDETKQECHPNSFPLSFFPIRPYQEEYVAAKLSSYQAF